MIETRQELWQIGKLPPYDEELERAILGMCIQDEDSRQEVIGMIRKEHFYVSNHAIVFDAIYTLYMAKVPVDILTVVNQLKKKGLLEQVGGAFEISKLTNVIGSSFNVREYCLIVMQFFLRRQSITIGTNIIQRGYDNQHDAISSIDSSINEMKSLYEHISFGGIGSSDNLLTELMNDIDNGIIPGKSTGIKALDEYIVCLEKGLKYTIGGRPGMGKTALAKSIACNLIRQDSPGMIFSMEITAKQFMLQIVSGECEINNEKLRKRELTDADKELIWHRMKSFRKDLLYIDGKSGITANYIAKKVKKAVKDHNIEWFMVDYTQMGKCDDPKGKTKEERIGEFSQGIKDVAKDNNVVAIELSQLTKASDKESKRPNLGDLKDSGSIEASADCVLLLYRPEYYGLKYLDKEKTIPSDGAAEIIVAKNRQGRLGSVESRFIPQFTKFTDWDTTKEQTSQEIIDYSQSRDMDF